MTYTVMLTDGTCHTITAHGKAIPIVISVTEWICNMFDITPHDIDRIYMAEALPIKR